MQAANRHLLSGLLLCRCGGPLHIFRKGERRYYRCSRNAQAAGCEHQPGIYVADDLERIVVDAVMERYGTPDLRAMPMAAKRISADSQRQGLTTALGQVTHHEHRQRLAGNLAPNTGTGWPLG